MAATWIKSLHVRKNKSKSSVVAAVIDYVENPDKTDGGRLITSYQCDARVADDQFILAKRKYEHITGRNQGSRDVLAYHIRQSFKPGEVSPEGVCCRGCFLRNATKQHSSHSSVAE